MDAGLQKLYSPSQWNKRQISPETIVNAHKLFFIEKSRSAFASVPNYRLKLSDHNEGVIDFFYKDENSLSFVSLDDGSVCLNFNGRKIFVYIHGGYWQWGSVHWSSFMAENFTQKDIIVAAIGYKIAPEANMDEIVSEVERALLVIASHANGSSPIYICGHSAGAHLAAMMLISDKLVGISGLILVSGIFDLTPLLHTDVNENLKMSGLDARRLSPMIVTVDTCLPLKRRPNVRVLLAYAQNESPAFKSQSIHYFKVLKSLNFTDCKCIEIADMDHFNIIENISDDNFELTKEIYKVMNV